MTDTKSSQPTTPLLTLTEEAAGHVLEMQAHKAEDAGKPLRVYVEVGGCSGLQYGMTFDQEREGDHIHAFHGVQVVIDPISADYLQGTVIDFQDTLNDGGFKIINPQARQSCGCGRSFEA